MGGKIISLGLKKEGRSEELSQADTQRLQSCPGDTWTWLGFPCPLLWRATVHPGDTKEKVGFVLAKRHDGACRFCIKYITPEATTVLHVTSEDLGAVKDGGGHGCSWAVGSPTAPATQDLDEMQILRLLGPSKQKLWGWADHQGL